jgi:hypothetical protein
MKPPCRHVPGLTKRRIVTSMVTNEITFISEVLGGNVDQ